MPKTHSVASWGTPLVGCWIPSRVVGGRHPGKGCRMPLQRCAHDSRLLRPPHVVRHHRSFIPSRDAELRHHLDEHDKHWRDFLGQAAPCPAHGAHKPQVVPDNPRASGSQGLPPHHLSAVTSTQTTHPRSTRTQAQSRAPSTTNSRPTSACPTTWVDAKSSICSQR